MGLSRAEQLMVLPDLANFPGGSLGFV
jgi:hypothetical protein